MPELPLSAYRVVDITQNVAGPFCTQILADLGADVIKIEPLEGDSTREWAPPFWDQESTMFMAFNRNKRSIALDLKRDEARELLDRMLENADVFVQALRPATAKKLGLDPKTLNRRHRHTLVCELTAFGAGGPLVDRPGYDPLLQSFSGLMSITGSEGAAAVRVGTSIVDMGAGMWAAIAIIGALLQKKDGNSGVGVVTTSLFETALAWMPYQILGFLATGEPPKRWGSGLAVLAPYGAYQTADQAIMIAVGSHKLWVTFCDALNRRELVNDERFASNAVRVRNRDALRIVIEEALSVDTAAAWVEQLTAAGVPVTTVNSIPEVLEHPQTEAVDMLQVGLLHDDFPLVGVPLSLDGQRPVPRTRPPKLGEHTKELLSRDMSLSDDEITRLESIGVIGTTT